MTKFDIPEKCHIRWQAALAVLEDLQEDTSAPFDMEGWADEETLWEKTNGCGSAACFGGYISVAPYCKALGVPEDEGRSVRQWLLSVDNDWSYHCLDLHRQIFHGDIDKDSRSSTLAYLEKTLKSIFKESTGKTLKAPLTFYVD